MASAVACRSLALFLAVVALRVTGAAAAGSSSNSSKSLNISNGCVHTIWPAISSGASSGFQLAPGQWEILAVPRGWSGRVWGRTLCSTDAATGKFTSVTGDCGSGRLDCAGGNAAPPATLAQFTMDDDDGSGGMDTYDVSLVDGFNLPLVVAPPRPVAPGGGGGNCTPAGCAVDLNAACCPAELRVTSSSAAGAVVACKSVCQASIGSPEYCCTGEYGNPETCKPSAYSELFKKACPRAVSYAYDDDDTGSTSTCGGGGTSTTYTITFCPSTASGKSSPSPADSQSAQPPVTGSLPHINGTTTPYAGGSQAGAPTAASPPRLSLSTIIGLVTAFVGLMSTVCAEVWRRLR